MSKYPFLPKAKELINRVGTLGLTKNITLILILIFSGTVVFDSTIVRYVTYTGIELPIWLTTVIFVILSAIFVVSSTIMLASVGKIVWNYKVSARTRRMEYLHITVSAVLVLTSSIIITIILQMIFLSNYNLFLVRILTYVSHTSPLVYLLFLIFLIGSWPTSRKNLIIILYTFSFLLVSVNLVVSLIYLETHFSRPDTTHEIKPYPIIAFVANIHGGPFTSLLSMIFDGLSLLSYLFMWVATALLLSYYRYRMGKIMFIFLMSLPLVYYVLPFQNYFGNVLFTMLQGFPFAIILVYLLIFSASKQVGALLFCLSFWTASKFVRETRLQKSLLMSSIGMVILFGSIALTPLQYHVYPPYGLITEAFIPIGAYLLFVGIFSSTIYISQDSALRREFYRSAASQLDLLKTIGVSQMEKEFEKKVEDIQAHFRQSGISENVYMQEEMDEHAVKETLREVLNELYSRRTKEEAHEPS
ncbi:MAG: hypothetical protein WBX01_06425 [Nitrososphaeraceae archaeon]